MLKLHKRVELRKLVVRFQCRIERALVFQTKRRAIRVVQPFRKVGRFVPSVARHHRFHRAAFGMPAHVDVRHLKYKHSILDRARFRQSPIERPSAVAGGMRLPTLRMVKRSPGSVEASKSGTTRLSEQVTNSASGA